MSQTIVLACPSCATRFSAPVEQFVPKGRRVRCSQCRHIWFHRAPGGVEASGSERRTPRLAPQRAVAGPIAEEAMDEPPARRPGAGWLRTLLWLVLALLILAILVYLLRDPLRRAVPALAPVLDPYVETVDRTALGLTGRTAQYPPLRWEGIHYDVREDDGDRRVLVEADVVNDGDEAQPAPRVRVRLVDGDRDPLLARIIEPEDGSDSIPAGGSTRYFVRIDEPPADFDAVLLNVYEE